MRGRQGERVPYAMLPLAGIVLRSVFRGVFVRVIYLGVWLDGS